MIRAQYLKDFIHGRPLFKGFEVTEQTEWQNVGNFGRQVKTVVIKLSTDDAYGTDIFRYTYKRVKIHHSYIYEIDYYSYDAFITCEELYV